MLRFTVAFTALALCALPVSVASAQQVGSAAALGANDSIDWSQVGPAYFSFSTPQTVTSAGGVTATLVDSNSPAERRDQSNGWSGNFAPGAPLIWNAGSGDLTLSFATPVRGIGAQVQSDSFGNFVGQLFLNNDFTAGYTFNGFSNGNADNSAIFAGFLSSTRNISSATFRVTSPNSSFALGNLALNTLEAASAVPEPSTWAMMIVGFGMIGGTTRQRVRNRAAIRSDRSSAALAG